MGMASRASAWGALLFLGAAVQGCQQESGGGPTMLEPRGQYYVTDLPVPKNFELQQRKSSHSSVAGKREISHLYEGKADPIAVKGFYIRQMKMSDWQLLNETLSNGVFTLNFEKNEETCEIRIERAPAAIMGEVTQIHATIHSRLPSYR